MLQTRRVHRVAMFPVQIVQYVQYKHDEIWHIRVYEAFQTLLTFLRLLSAHPPDHSYTYCTYGTDNEELFVSSRYSSSSFSLVILLEGVNSGFCIDGPLYCCTAFLKVHAICYHYSSIFGRYHKKYDCESVT